ncbi:MAG: hypothetical protein IID51_14690 [Proteobacteria bacterium]|nr:hypothetical protein [Pseudomonadota bacterium]
MIRAGVMELGLPRINADILTLDGEQHIDDTGIFTGKLALAPQADSLGQQGFGGVAHRRALESAMAIF